MRFKLGSTVYALADLDRVSLRDILVLERETVEFGHPLRWTDVQAMSEALDALETEKERAEHPDALWITAVTIWASRRIAGEDVTFDQAVDFPMRDLVFLPDPGDHKEAANPSKPERKSPTRKGSARAGSAAARPRGKRPTSNAASTGD